MALLRILDGNTVHRNEECIISELAGIGIAFKRWRGSYDVSPDAPDDEIIQAYSAEIEKLKNGGGYTIVDVVGLSGDTEGLDETREKYSREHWHDDDEVRFLVKGRGIFYIAPEGSSVMAIELEPGEAILIPKGMYHWFEFGPELSYRAIRLFTHPHGSIPYFTESGRELKFRTAG